MKTASLNQIVNQIATETQQILKSVEESESSYIEVIKKQILYPATKGYYAGLSEKITLLNLEGSSLNIVLPEFSHRAKFRLYFQLALQAERVLLLCEEFKSGIDPLFIDQTALRILSAFKDAVIVGLESPRLEEGHRKELGAALSFVEKAFRQIKDNVSWREIFETLKEPVTSLAGSLKQSEENYFERVTDYLN